MEIFNTEKDLKDYCWLAWKSNELLHLQRLAHKEAGFCAWERRAKNVHIVLECEVLAVLDVNEPGHPLLSKVPVLSKQPMQPTSDTTHIYHS